MTNFAFLLTSIVLVVYSNLVVKARAGVHAHGGADASVLRYLADMLLDPLVWTAVMAMGIGAVTWLLAIRQLQLGVAQPAMSLVFVIVPLAAAFFLGEPLPALRIAGLVLIVAGVLLVARTA
jgi:drug/metabolite transporter (DMT)-like permease